MNSLEFVKEMEQLKDICNKVYGHLKSHAMTTQTLKWDVESLQAKVYDAQQSLRDLEVKQEEAKAQAEKIILEAKANAELANAEIAAKRKELQEYEESIQKREDRFERSKYLKGAPSIA